jgi:DNA-binding LacI/PurR family transcriptional regulator
MGEGFLTLRNGKTKRVTLADVAAKAGVSVATASVAITGRRSGNCRVSTAVADKIRQAAASLNYRPNLQARNLSTQRTHTVAILIKRAAWHNAMFYLPVMQQLLREAKFGEMCILYPDNAVQTEQENLDLCVSRRVEGIIALPVIDLQGRANVELFNQIHTQEQIPIVQFTLALAGCVAPAVVSDEAQAMADAVRRLHEQGHTRIAHATVPGHDNPEPLNPFRLAHLRYQGYRRAMAELRLSEQVLTLDPDLLNLEDHFAGGVEIAQRIARREPGARPTAIVTFSDYLAAGLLSGFIDAGIDVPKEISLVAVGDQPFDKMLCPPLTTLAPPFAKMAEIATHSLLQMIEGQDVAPLTTVPFERVERKSVGPAAR